MAVLYSFQEYVKINSIGIILQDMMQSKETLKILYYLHSPIHMSTIKSQVTHEWRMNLTDQNVFFLKDLLGVEKQQVQRSLLNRSTSHLSTCLLKQSCLNSMENLRQNSQKFSKLQKLWANQFFSLMKSMHLLHLEKEEFMKQHEEFSQLYLGRLIHSNQTEKC